MKTLVEVSKHRNVLFVWYLLVQIPFAIWNMWQPKNYPYAFLCWIKNSESLVLSPFNHNDRPPISDWDMVQSRFGGTTERRRNNSDNRKMQTPIILSGLHKYIILLQKQTWSWCELGEPSQTCSEHSVVPRRAITNRSSVNRHWKVICYSHQSTDCAWYNSWFIQEGRLLIQCKKSKLGKCYLSIEDFVNVRGVIILPLEKQCLWILGSIWFLNPIKR